jgi:septum formation protein
VNARLVLASGSARRRDILGLLGLEFDVRTPEVDESARSGETAADTAIRLAIEKTMAVPRAADELVVAADTLVVVEQQVLGKPGGAAEAEEMLACLSGRSHTVLTGIAMAWDGAVEADVAATTVRFRSAAGSEISDYVATGESLDKAGAYGIQGFGAALVDCIEGDFYNVMGLPIPAFIELLSKHGLRYRFGTPASIESRSTSIHQDLSL